jgi:molybdate transport system ATP-binding protein
VKLEVDIGHRLGAFTLEARFGAESGLTALFGRSGTGKTSIINAIAGLLRPERGRVALGGEVLFDAQAGIFVPPHRRRIGYVFQEARLFPHLTVRQNLLYGRWFSRGSTRRGTLDGVVAMLGVERLLDRRPGELSGGEKQRVAIGRALLAEPRLLLMDEPLASLDAHRKSEILPYIEKLRDEARIPIVYVSHSVPEVARLATTLVLISDGRIEAVGPVAEIMGRLDLQPMTGRFEAGAILSTRVAAHDRADGLTRLRCAVGDIRVPHLDLPVGAAVRLRIRARDVLIAVTRPGGLSALNVLPGHIAELAPGGGALVDVRIDLAGDALLARVTRRAAADLGLVAGKPVFAIIKTVALDRRSLGRIGGVGEIGAGATEEDEVPAIDV